MTREAIESELLAYLSEPAGMVEWNNFAFDLLVGEIIKKGKPVAELTLGEMMELAEHVRARVNRVYVGGKG
ncbi:hypothetical protein MJO47_09195 [Desulfuromonas sp. KJ2020]|uniref:hypothetical protein n=1 Tax=Desulfuromonas sp. KJ2020 TaxID=2919173 RepID=UPI0020A7B49F|nr:hypothetical protein [Desulfuromonas sp. KJ2020]MCP3177272.1 hypothetical protein [Desulfuromonas sp. KJ2020]